MATTIQHDEYDDLHVSVQGPTEDSWGEYMAGAGRAATKPDAEYNLLLACLVKPSNAELGPIVDDWPGLPSRASGEIMILGGFAIFTALGDIKGLPAAARAAMKAGDNAEQIDPLELIDVELIGAEDLDGLATRRAAEAFLTDLAAELPAPLEGDARTPVQRAREHVATWVQKWPRKDRKGQITKLRILRTRQGIVAYHGPSFSVFSRYLANLESGLYRAARKLVLDVALHPSPEVLVIRFAEFPALATSLHSDVRDMADENAAVTVKKG